MNRHFWELQAADNHVSALHRERARLDDGSSARASRDTLQSAFDQERATLNALNARRSAKEDELKTAEEKLSRQNSRLMSARSAHEITALQRDISALQSARGELDEAILTLMDEAETSARHLKELDAKLREAQADFASVETNFATHAARLKTELQTAVRAREEAALKLAPAELTKYTNMAAKQGGVAVASVNNGACSECGTTLSTFILRAARTEEYANCEGCNRLLWVE